MTSIQESFPWLYYENGEAINTSAPVRLDNVVSLVSRYLVARYDIQIDKLSPEFWSKLNTAVLEAQEGDRKLTALELYKYISDLRTNTPELFNGMLQTGTPELVPESSEPGPILTGLDSSKPLGAFGDTTLN